MNRRKRMRNTRHTKHKWSIGQIVHSTLHIVKIWGCGGSTLLRCGDVVDQHFKCGGPHLFAFVQELTLISIMVTHTISAFIHFWNVIIHISTQYINIQNLEMWWIRIRSTFYMWRSILNPLLKRYGYLLSFCKFKTQLFYISLTII